MVRRGLKLVARRAHNLECPFAKNIIWGSFITAVFVSMGWYMPKATQAARKNFD
jgi:hypothetical protein